VLDLGSGTGDVAFVAAELVGPDGEVAGIDSSPEAVATAQARAQQRGLGNGTHATLLRPGGIVAPIEFDLGSARSLPATPLAHQLLAWLADTFQRAGIDPSLGARLWAVLRQAGLRPAGDGGGPAPFRAR